MEKQKIKEFITKHGTKLKIAGAISIGVTGVMLGRYWGNTIKESGFFFDERITEVLDDLLKRDPQSKVVIVTSMRPENPISLKDCGEIGKSLLAIKPDSVSDDIKFTHFIAFSEEIKP